MDLFKRRLPNHTEIAYREAVAKLKYLLAESYAPRVATLTSIGCKGSAMGKQLGQIDEYRGDEELESATSDASKRQDTSAFAESTRSLVKCHSTRTATNNNNNNNDKIGVPPAELSSFIDRQEEYIEQLEKESQYCREELKALVDKVREVSFVRDEDQSIDRITRRENENSLQVIAENEALQDKNKTQFFRSHAPADSTGQRYEGPSIVFESRISELEAQLTQTRLELRKAQEDSRSSLTETRHSSQEQQHHQQQQQQQQQLELERATREKHELEAKLDEYQRELARLRSRDADVRLRSKRATEVAQQAEYQKVQAELEISRLKDELERRQDKLREALQETNRRIVEEKQQVERRFSQQMEQLSADVVSHWEAASKSHLEAEKHKRQLADLARDLAEKQALVDDLTNDLRQKTTSNAKLEEQARAITIERDAAREQVANLKLAAETSERQTRQEQGRVQSEINSYKARLERTEDELAHARREHVRLTEEIAALEKEINMNKIVEETRVGVLPTSKLSDKSKEEKDKDKELAALIYDLEGKHASSGKKWPVFKVK